MKKLIILILGITLVYSCSNQNNENFSIPILTTKEVTSAGRISAAWSGGTILNDGGTSIISSGVVWSTSTNPTIDLSTKTLDGTATGDYQSFIVNGLMPNTMYYFRAYATNIAGTAYGNELTYSANLNIAGSDIIDIDGNVYQTIKNWDKTWTKKNLNVTKYSDGTIIPQVTDDTQWAALTTGAWCYYKNDPANEAIYGKLYNWYATVGIYDIASLNDQSLRKKLAPQGSHIPTISEWNDLSDYLDLDFQQGGTNAGVKMKEQGIIHWISPNKGADNSSGFTALPGGYRERYSTFYDINTLGRWWSLTENENDGLNYAKIFTLYTRFTMSSIHYAIKKCGASVRCVKD